MKWLDYYFLLRTTTSAIRQKGRISKRMLQEMKAHQIFRKTNISYPLMRTRMCA